MPDPGVIPMATLPMRVGGVVRKPQNVAVITALRATPLLPFCGNPAEEDLKAKKQRLAAETLSSCFLVMYDKNEEGRLVPSAAIAPTGAPAVAMAVGKGFNFRPPEDTRSPAHTRLQELRPEALSEEALSDADEDGTPPGLSRGGSVRSLLVRNSSFRNRDRSCGNLIRRRSSRRLAKFKVPQKTRYAFLTTARRTRRACSLPSTTSTRATRRR
ncbi:hypothetical protein STCU_11430 [Strigomonas culicis]|uniref:Uncharacterized protein n=1 Tax=Strigomonas culicis TaxID=28005 RepID=S9UNM1_9TRYP|nr:hypothetical protein STCU_11430 [Strigomonas culicis]|eukprot:EPY16276.1 hypothetical protein STCU_11430 [Strigomonas culicis]